MNSTKNSVFFAKCPFCAKEHHNCQESFINQNVIYTKCHKTFTLIKLQSDTQIES
jgi:hypothetical protein